MVQQQPSQEADSVSYEVGLKIRDLEENQRLTRDRILLIGQNLIEFQEKNITEITQIKRGLTELKDDIKRIKEIVQTFSEEIAKSARKEELAMVMRQMKMFEPLNYARIEDVEKIVDEKINKHPVINKSEREESKEVEKEDKHAFWRGKV